MGVLSLVFLCSGAAGLIYQVIWVRQFESCFGSSVYAVAMVTAIFMSGLGVGAHVTGRLADRHLYAQPRRAVHAYGLVEVCIGALCVASAYALPLLGDLVALSSSYAVGLHGWLRPSIMSWVARAVVALVCLAPIALLMGATLTLLIRACITDDTAVAGRRIGLLYAAYALGAGLGAIVTDTALVPAVGLFATEAIGAGLHILAGLWAIRSAQRLDPTLLAGPTIAPPSVPPPQAGLRIAPIAVAVTLTGFAAMGMQVVWFRQLSAVLRPQHRVFSLLLGVMLVAYALGALLGGRLSRRADWVRVVYSTCVSGFAASALWALTTLVKAEPAPASSELLFILGPIARAALLPSFFLGATFPLANAAIQEVAQEVGERAGMLYLGNRLGAVAGALAAGLLLIPTLGVVAAAAAAAIAAVVAAAILVPGGGPNRLIAVVPTAVAMVITTGFTGLPRATLVLQSIPDRSTADTILALSEGVSETLLVTERPGLERRLVTDGHAPSGTAAIDQRTGRLLAHIPLLMMRAPERVLVIGFGVGNTAHAALTHPIERLDVVERSENVLDQAHYFGPTHSGVLRDPRVRVHVNDGREHLRMTEPLRYDLITVEPPPLSRPGVASLYALEFYALARSRLRTDGLMTQSLPLRELPPVVALGAVRAFVAVFPHAALLSGAGDELILIGQNASELTVDPPRWVEGLQSRPAVSADLEAVFAATTLELLGTFVASARHLDAVTRDVAPLTDDRPIMEYASSIVGAPPARSEALFATETFPAFCRRCAQLGEEALLDDYLRLWGALYDGDAPLEPTLGAQAERRAEGVRVGLTAAQLDALVDASPYTRSYLSTPGDEIRRARALETAGDPAGAEARLRQAVALWPTMAEARVALAERLEAGDRVDEARSLLDEALRIVPSSTTARAARAAMP